MIYDLRLAVCYDYGGPADAGRCLLRLTPADLPDEQRVVASRLDIEPVPHERIDRVDFFGARVVEAAFRDPVETVEFRLAARVERLARAPSLDLSPLLERLHVEVRETKTLGPDAPHHYLGTSDRAGPDPATTAFAEKIAPQAATVLDLVRAIGLALHGEMRFDAKATTVDTPFADAFARRHGVCQDFTHVMIACLRGLGVPAGYVSGLIRTTPPPGKPRLEGADAMHAWVRAWCGIEAGWIEYDPTNAQMVGPDHIVIARGRDYADVSPVRGSLRTAGPQTSRHSVDMIPLGEAAAVD